MEKMSAEFGTCNHTHCAPCHEICERERHVHVQSRGAPDIVLNLLPGDWVLGCTRSLVNGTFFHLILWTTGLVNDPT